MYVYTWLAVAFRLAFILFSFFPSFIFRVLKDKFYYRSIVESRNHLSTDSESQYPFMLYLKFFLLQKKHILLSLIR